MWVYSVLFAMGGLPCPLQCLALWSSVSGACPPGRDFRVLLLVCRCLSSVGIVPCRAAVGIVAAAAAVAAMGHLLLCCPLASWADEVLPWLPLPADDRNGSAVMWGCLIVLNSLLTVGDWHAPETCSIQHYCGRKSTHSQHSLCVPEPAV